MKFLRCFFLIVLSLTCTACTEFFWGLGCTARIVFSRDEKLDVVELPTAVVGQYYEYTLSCREDTSIDCGYMEWRPDFAKEDLPQGLELVPVSVPLVAENGDEFSQKGWMLHGTPLQAEVYKFNIIGYKFRSMCGKSDDIYRYKLNIIQAESSR